MGRYNFDTKVGVLLDDPKAKAVFKKYVPQLLSHPMLGMARGFRLRDLEKYAGMAGIQPAMVQKIRKEIEQL